MSKTIIAIAIAVILVGGGGAAAAFIMLNNNGNNNTPDTPDTPGEDFKIDVLKDKVEVGDFIEIKATYDLRTTGGQGYDSWSLSYLYNGGTSTGELSEIEDSFLGKTYTCKKCVRENEYAKYTFWNDVDTNITIKQIRVENGGTTYTYLLKELTKLKFVDREEQKKIQCDGSTIVYDLVVSGDTEYNKTSGKGTSSWVYTYDDKGTKLTKNIVSGETEAKYKMIVEKIYVDEETGANMISIKGTPNNMTVDTFLSYLSYEKLKQNPMLFSDMLKFDSQTQKTIDTNFGKRNVTEDKYIYQIGDENASMFVEHNSDVVYSYRLLVSVSDIPYSAFTVIDTNMFV